MRAQIIRLITTIPLFTKIVTSHAQSIEFTTAKEINETITLKIWTKRSNENTVWIDFNNNKQKEDNEHIRLSPYNWDLSRAHAEIKFPLRSQEFRVYGNITRLECTSQKIKKLSIFHTFLEFLDCSYNQLAKLDVTEQPLLERLECKHNKLTKLDISQNKKLRYLECQKNQLTTLDVSKNKELDELNCGQNQLTALDVSKNKELSKLRCLYNKITQLDLSQNIELLRFSCHSNLLKTIDLSHNLDLRELSCGQNDELRNLDISHNKFLYQLDCDDRLILNSQLSYHTSTGEEYIITAQSGLTVRERPTTKSRRLGKLEFEETIMAKKTNIPFEAEEINNYWYKVEYQGNKAYVFGGFLKKNN